MRNPLQDSGKEVGYNNIDWMSTIQGDMFDFYRFIAYYIVSIFSAY